MSTVIIVPGICGSELRLTGIPWLSGVPLWISPGLLASPLWRLLALAPDGVSPQIPGQPPLAPGPALPFVYLALAAALRVAGHHVLYCDLDWRQTQDRCAVRLRDFILAHYRGESFHLVCHSRGGLVARRAIGLLQQTGQASLVWKVVGLGVPHQGSYAPAGIFGGWDQFARFLEIVIGGLAVALGNALLAVAILDVAASWPALYELLPAPGAVNTTPASIDAMYDPVRWASIRQSVSPAWLAAARASWGTLPTPPGSVPWLNLVGSGQPTPYAVADINLLPGRDGIAWTLDGDGTVPVVWGQLAGRPTQVMPVSHSQLVEDAATLQAVTGFLAA